MNINVFIEKIISFVELNSTQFQKKYMIDLTTKNEDEINQLIEKYSSALSSVYPDQIPYLVYIFELGINYIKEKHNDLDINWKSWCMVLLKKLFLNKKINDESDIKNNIDDFIKYKEKKYKNYCDDLAIYASEYDRDFAFIYSFLFEKNNDQ